MNACHNKVKQKDVKDLCKGHEIAVHTLTHPNLTTIEDDEEVIRQVEQDRLNLSELCGYEVIGMAYPCGGNLRLLTPQFFTFGGHLYEFDIEEDGWDKIEKFCKILSGKSDIYYDTNKEVLLK